MREPTTQRRSQLLDIYMCSVLPYYLVADLVWLYLRVHKKYLDRFCFRDCIIRNQSGRLQHARPSKRPVWIHTSVPP